MDFVDLWGGVGRDDGPGVRIVCGTRFQDTKVLFLSPPPTSGTSRVLLVRSIVGNQFYSFLQFGKRSFQFSQISFNDNSE